MDFEEHIPEVMTAAEVADYLGVSVAHVAQWADAGQLRAAARSEGGLLLFYRWRVERDGKRLAAAEPHRLIPTRRKRVALLIEPHKLPCGCCFAGATGEAARQPVWLCSDARSLQLAERLTIAFAAAAPRDPFFQRLANVTREALARHIGGTAGLDGGDGSNPAAPIGCATIDL